MGIRKQTGKRSLAAQWALLIALGALGLGSQDALAQADAATAQRIAKTEQRFNTAKPTMSKATVSAVDSNFYLVRKLARGEKLGSFDGGMAAATAGQHGDKAGCKGVLAGLLCEIDAQIDEATGKAAKAPDCSKAADIGACLKAQIDKQIGNTNTGIRELNAGAKK